MKTAAVDRIKTIGASVLLCVGAGLVLWRVHESYPLQHWMLWRYALYWAASASFSVACLSCGFRLTRYVFPPLPSAEQLALSFAVGVFVFFWGVFVAGILGLYGHAFAFAWPIAMTVIGAKPTFAYVRRLARFRPNAYHAAKSGRLSKAWQPSKVVQTGILAVGIVNLAYLYVCILHPGQLGFDAVWYHLTIAEQYVAEGAIKPFVEGWFVGTYPHLASVLYAWAFQLPFNGAFHRAELALHLEFTVFLWTLLGITALASRLLGRTRVRFAWVAFFLFPEIFVYPSSFVGGSDHFAALWAPAILCAMFRTRADSDVKRWSLTAAMAAGAVLTKYTAVCLVAFPALYLTYIFIWRLVRDPQARNWRSLAGPAAALLCSLLFTTPHWLKNWVYYGDPLYPFLHKYLSLHPWTPPDTGAMFDREIAGNVFGSTAAKSSRFWHSIGDIITYGFKAHDPGAARTVPLQGFLFSLLIPLVFFRKNSSRLYVTAAATYVGVAAWYFTYPEDRYLQILTPWMAGFVAAVLGWLFSQARLVRWATAGLTFAQLAAGADAYFMPIHYMLGQHPLKAVVDLLGKGYQGKYEERFRAYEENQAMGKALPLDAKLLYHSIHLRFGLERVGVSDAPRFVGAIVYGRLGTSRAVYDKFRELGVTHVAWLPQPPYFYDSFADAIVFYRFAMKYVQAPKSYGSWKMGKLPSAPPPLDPLEQKVAYFGCQTSFESGLYELSDFHILTNSPHESDRVPARVPEGAPSAEGLRAFADKAGALVIDTAAGCQRELPRAVRAQFTLSHVRSSRFQIWIRKE